jgi:protein O-GlcNAc transferase
MSIFDRFRTVGSSIVNNNETVVPAQDATRLIEQGHALEAQGKADEAMQCYLEAIRLAPNPARAHLNRGNLLLSRGDLPGALQAFRAAIEHKPDYAGAYYNIGNALLSDGQLEQAVANYRRALEIQPDYAEVHCVLGIALKELGQVDDAIASFRTALQINPELVEARTNIGNILGELFNTGNALLKDGKLDAAIAQYRLALKIEPNLAEAHYSMGDALKQLGLLDAAMDSYHSALQIKPDYAEAHVSIGIIQHDQGRFESAMASYRRALEVKPDYAEAHFDLGNALKDLDRLDDAVASYRKALEIKPRLIEAHNNMGLALQELGQLDSAIASYHRALELRPDFVDAHSNLLLALNYNASHTSAYFLEQARRFGQVVAENVGARFSSWQCEARPERLRVGLVSGDLRKHSVGHFLEGLLAHLDLSRIELIAYPTHHEQDELTERIRPCFSAWKPLFDKSDEAAARLIHGDGVHVLIDVSGHTKHNRLPVFAWKPAPVQVTWLGLPATTGVAEMDYVLGDPWAIPERCADQFSEAVWRLPESYVCLTVPSQSVEVGALPAQATGAVTFGSFNNLTKMNDTVVAVWSRILEAVPNARLLLKAKQLSDAAVCAQTRQRFAACGIAPERLQLQGILASRNEHLATYHQVDIALDTFPYPGVTTSVEALWMGVPVLSLQGDRFLSCTAASIAHNAGLPEWIAAGQDDYVAKAVTFASDLPKLAALRAGLREQVLASPLFDAPRFARHFEEALWGMWQHYREQAGA